MILQEQFHLTTKGRGTYNVTNEVQAIVHQSGVSVGICQVFIHHTSASLILCENADPVVRQDLETFMLKIVPDGDPSFQHIDEGDDDMPAHVRSILTQNSINIPVRNGRCDLGTWQDIYLWEHRYRGYRRQITVTVMGE